MIFFIHLLGAKIQSFYPIVHFLYSQFNLEVKNSFPFIHHVNSMNKYNNYLKLIRVLNLELMSLFVILYLIF